MIEGDKIDNLDEGLEFVSKLLLRWLGGEHYGYVQFNFQGESCTNVNIHETKKVR